MGLACVCTGSRVGVMQPWRVYALGAGLPLVLTFWASASVTLMHEDSLVPQVLGYLAGQAGRVHVLPRQVPGRAAWVGASEFRCHVSAAPSSWACCPPYSSLPSCSIPSGGAQPGSAAQAGAWADSSVSERPPPRSSRMRSTWSLKTWLAARRPSWRSWNLWISWKIQSSIKTWEQKSQR